jgi:lipocalin
MPLEHMQVSVQLQWLPQYRGRGAHLGASRYLGKAYNVAGVPIHDTKQYSNTRTVFSKFQSLRGSNHHD